MRVPLDYFYKLSGFVGGSGRDIFRQETCSEKRPSYRNGRHAADGKVGKSGAQTSEISAVLLNV
jgi:hypothetical protein